MPELEPEDGTSSWLYDHVGRIAGALLALMFFAGVAFLAVIGYTPARALLIIVFAGTVMIVLGGKMHAR